MFPNWIGWKNPLARDMTDMTVDQLIAHTRPRVMGRYDNGEVFAVRRNIGKGQVMMLTSGCFPVWNNIAAEHSVLIFDRVLRTLLTRSLPGRTLDPVNEIVIPIESRDQAATFTFKRPNDTEGKPISIEALGESSYGLIVRSLGQRGQYELKREGDENSQWTMRLAMNGPSQESELLAVTKTDFDEKMEMSELRWVAIDDAISLEGEAQFGRNMWKWLMSAVVVMLFVEMLFLSPWVSAWFGTLKRA
jgi:hypothetical protein